MFQVRGKTEFPAKYLNSPAQEHSQGITLDDTALIAILASIKGLCLVDFVELQHLKKLLRHHLNIGEEFGLYKQSVGEYLARLEQNTVIVAKAIEERERLGQEGTKNPQQKI